MMSGQPHYYIHFQRRGNGSFTRTMRRAGQRGPALAIAADLALLLCTGKASSPPVPMGVISLLVTLKHTVPTEVVTGKLVQQIVTSLSLEIDISIPNLLVNISRNNFPKKARCSQLFGQTSHFYVFHLHSPVSSALSCLYFSNPVNNITVIPSRKYKQTKIPKTISWRTAMPPIK